MKLVLKFWMFCALLVSVSVSAAPAKSAASAKVENHWVGSWATAVYATESRGLSDVTLRQIAHVSIGGKQLRVRFSNEYGNQPLRIGGAAVALAGAEGAITPGSSKPLRFAGREVAIVPPGATIYSDAVDLELPAFADLAIDLYLPSQDVGNVSFHNDARQTNYMAAGNQLSRDSLEKPSKQAVSFFLSAVEVMGGKNARAIVALGDSITDGAQSTRDTNRRWPDLLARRLAQDKRGADVGVLNLGIGGNRLLNFGTGPATPSRFDTQVLTQHGVSHVILLISINDIGRWGRPHIPTDEISADDIISTYQQLIDRAHTHGLKIIGATLTPYEGAGYFSPKGEEIRQAVNRFIRESGQFDGVADFDAATRDTERPSWFSKATDSGDHLHPNDAGMEAMANAVDLDLLLK